MTSELIVLIISTLFIAIGGKLWQKGSQLQNNGKKAKAIIFRSNRSRSGMYYPVVRFLTEKNEWITQELSIGYSQPRPDGEEIEVIYDPDDPTTVEINSPLQLEMLPVFFVSIGVVGYVVGVLVYVDVLSLK